MNTKALLILMGLTEKQAQIYQVLAENGPGGIADIERETGLHRPTIYKELPILEAKHLLSTHKVGKRTKYVPTSPDVILGNIDVLKKSIDESAADLRSAYANRTGRPKVQYFAGREGIKIVISDLVRTLKRGDTYYRYGSRRSSTDIKRYQPADFTHERARKTLQRFVITSKERATNYDNDMNRKVKTVPEKLLFADDIQLMIYRDKISIIDYESETGIIIEHQKLASFQQKIFSLLFDRL